MSDKIPTYEYLKNGSWHDASDLMEAEQYKEYREKRNIQEVHMGVISAYIDDLKAQLKSRDELLERAKQNMDNKVFYDEQWLEDYTKIKSK